MKKNIPNVILFSTLLIASTSMFTTACAQELPYEPVFENIPITESLTTAKAEPTQQVSSMTPVAAPSQNTTPAVSNNASTVESGNLQSALMQLDSAQVEIRNQLIQYKSEYTNLDNQYRTIKEQRAAKAKQVKETEKKIKSLDETKEKIRKNLN